MKNTNRLSTTLLLLGAIGVSTNSAAFIDMEEWKMDKWGKWDEWEGMPDMKEWREDQWGDMPWSGKGGKMPWGNSGGGMPWGNNGGGMPWEGGRSHRNQQPQQWNPGGWGQPYGYAPQSWGGQPQMQPTTPQLPRYPSRPKVAESVETSPETPSEE
ncbi:MAG: hypothetical protein HN842_01005 [Gammaproteobacteria bacterium]|jgi:hypothetical protein|nr:hypothetical protein [Gammaproteobacteria bacterium]MBT7306761.1 hypothetical protein [Gammaproteobacteria bacterium]